MERFKTPRQTDLFYFNRINAWKTSSELSLVIIILNVTIKMQMHVYKVHSKHDKGNKSSEK